MRGMAGSVSQVAAARPLQKDFGHNVPRGDLVLGQAAGGQLDVDRDWDSDTS